MKTSIKTFACTTAISLVFLACSHNEEPNANVPSSSSNYEMPVMDSRVVAYDRHGAGVYKYLVEVGDSESSDYYHLGDFNGIGIGISTVKNPDIFDEERPECNYFAIDFSYPQSTHDYWILSQDMTLYQIKPGIHTMGMGCMRPAIPDFAAMLVCDDTAEGNLRDKIKIDSIQSLNDPTWDCGK